MDFFNDSDFIEATPLTNRDPTENDIVNPTPEKSTRKRQHKAKTKFKTDKRITETLEEQLNLINTFAIQETVCGSVQYNKPYIYFDIIEIKKFLLKNILKHNNVHLVGFYKYNHNNGQILTAVKNVYDCDFLKLDFTLTTEKPVEDNVISVYGSVEVRLPNDIVLIVNFFRMENEAYYKQYKDNLKFIRNFIPKCYFDTMS